MLRLCSGCNVVAVGESNKTWALLCGNNTNTNGNNGNNNNECNMVLNIFWHHYFGQDLVRNMYNRDDSYLKSATLPCSER